MIIIIYLHSMQLSCMFGVAVSTIAFTASFWFHGPAGPRWVCACFLQVCGDFLSGFHYKNMHFRVVGDSSESVAVCV